MRNCNTAVHKNDYFRRRRAFSDKTVGYYEHLNCFPVDGPKAGMNKEMLTTKNPTLTAEDAEDAEKTRNEEKRIGDRSEVTVFDPLPPISTLLEHPQLELPTLVCFFSCLSSAPSASSAVRTDLCIWPFPTRRPRPLR